MLRISTAILGLVTLSGLLSKAYASSPTVDLTLVAPWSAPDFLLEVAETIAVHNEESYYRFIDIIRTQQESYNWTPRKVYEEAVKAAASLKEIDVDLLKLSLSLHEAAPRIEAYFQYYNQLVTANLTEYDHQCDVWVHIGDKQICDLELLTDTIKDLKDTAYVNLLPFDHITDDTLQKPTVVLYTDSFSAKFNMFYTWLKDAADQHKIAYIIRYRPPVSDSMKKSLYLSGYGVEMALKKTDYLVIDDRKTQDGKSQHVLKEKLLNFGKKLNHALFDTTEEANIQPLTPSEISQLGLKAAQYIAKSNNTLETMSLLAQDFPKYAKSISMIELDKEFENEVLENQYSSVQGGLNAVWINGKALELRQVDPFYLVRLLRDEKKLIQSIQAIGFSPKEAIEILSNPALSEGESMGNDIISGVYDVRDTPENPFVIWWNDIEKDTRYEDWPSNIMEILKPTYPGQLHPIRKNIYNLLLVEDLASTASLSRIVNEIQTMIKRTIPIRFGLIAFVEDDNSASTLMARALYYFIKNNGKADAIQFLETILELTSSNGLDRATTEMIERAFNGHMSISHENLNSEQVIDQSQAFITATRQFMKRMGISQLKPNEGIMFMNGKLLEFDEERPWIHSLMPHLTEQTRFIQTMAYNQEFDPDLDYYEYTLSQPNVVQKRNPYILVSHTNPLRMHTFDAITASKGLKYFQNDNESLVKTNLWVVSDFDTANGLKLLLEAILFAEANPKVRVAFIHKSIHKVSTKDTNDTKFSDLLCKLIYEQDTNLTTLKEILQNTNLFAGIDGYSSQNPGEVTIQINGDGLEPVPIIPGTPITEMVAKAQREKWSNLNTALVKDGLEPDFTGIIMNGRVIGPLSLSENIQFTNQDFEILYQYENTKRIMHVEKAIVESGKDLQNNTSDAVMKLTAIIENDKAQATQDAIESREPVHRIRQYQKIPRTQYTQFIAGGYSDDTFLEIGLIIDPLSEAAQKIAPIVHTLSEIEGVSVVTYLNPVSTLQELPLKRFYRYVFDKEPHFDTITGEKQVPTAYFANLPVKPLYTLGVETTNAWHVTVKEANMDLDNILLTSIPDNQHGVSAVYELQSILVEGHCLDSINKSPPRGLEFELISPSGLDKKDTLVMANLGYFQLKASPGIWKLALREGRSSSVYSIQDVGANGKWNWNTEFNGSKGIDDTLALISFEGLTITPLVHKNPGMEDEDVLEPAQPKSKKNAGGLWSSINQKIFGTKETENASSLANKATNAEINIFSVASGKLYERFLSIMMASVMKHTKSTVKFWFIENFLSPEFKDFVPHMAKEYGFDYEMVTYKWPAWLRAQHEKQRTIWGYKILFLDVLFPLSLDKVIFVDADQIVRTDLKELIDMDLHGAPYGYTPFCSDRTEMDGFRFWKEGYWKNHLRGKPYHISALYVVDLVRFRQLAAGDRLRAQYQQLSADPNSLANLDQDLPNNMQHIVPIYSLPQEWLWCETWCSDESLKKAKTIDLCNNPLTKEPKLDRARRQVPEWETYDKEIDELRKRITAGGSSSLPKQDEPSIKKHLKDEL
ncbi:hypothetical protein G6F70_003865 [Rhizopus microsporus]|uniref:UDP-glucose:glycoprotein glucosyltransferase n=2 Tax=Rhizopus TaxID=4842 RepID=A0A1X0RVJ3_RHIZD|nr:hypothetical protein G6F71_003843 [Rhizopus microsporus]KAG1200669.1 hypothetical protein G6F70_003865 [Rhizopus microsporus]KAG1213151.1 hypothetical protein G6F69_003085 [Rhizopus microsporus]ORE16037.1 hypothetical protein BCV71DRAFT_24100 [Rhizopus microsporus]